MKEGSESKRKTNLVFGTGIRIDSLSRHATRAAGRNIPHSGSCVNCEYLPTDIRSSIVIARVVYREGATKRRESITVTPHVLHFPSGRLRGSPQDRRYAHVTHCTRKVSMERSFLSARLMVRVINPRLSHLVS